MLSLQKLLHNRHAIKDSGGVFRRTEDLGFRCFEHALPRQGRVGSVQAVRGLREAHRAAGHHAE